MPPLEAKPGGKEKGTVLIRYGLGPLELAIVFGLLTVFLTFISVLLLIIGVKI